MRVEFIRPGPAGLDWVARQVAELKKGALLAPVTIVVTNYVVGRFVLRYLARGGGLVNVHAARLVDLATSGLGGPAELLPLPLLTTSLEMGAIRAAVEAAGGDTLMQLAHQFPLYRELLRLFRELRRQEMLVDEPAIPFTRAAMAVYESFSQLTAPFVDASRIRHLAAQRLERGPAPRPMGQVLVYLPARIDPADARLLAAVDRWAAVRIGLANVGDPIGDAESEQSADTLRQYGAQVSGVPDPASVDPSPRVRVVRAPDPAEEVREVVRRVLRNLEDGVPLPKQAILYRQTDPYGVLVRETLGGAGLPWSALDGQPLALTAPGRALLAAVRVGQVDFSREAVLAWLTSLPEHVLAEYGHSADWDRLSRDANVVRGAAQWQRRLDVYAREAVLESDERERQGNSTWAETLRHRAGEAQRVARIVRELAEALGAPPDGSTWSAFCQWAERLRIRFASDRGEWPEPHDRASALVAETLSGLAEADRFPTNRPLSVTDFVTTLEAALGESSVPQGRLGVGVVIGPIQSATGFAFAAVHILGLTEGAFPPAPAPDPFFPDETQDPLRLRARARAADRRSFLSALAAADSGQITLSAPESLVGRSAFPSRWLLDIAGTLTGGQSLDALRFRRVSETAHPWLRIVRSTLDGVTRAPTVRDLDERRARELATWRREGRSIARSALAARADIPLGAGLELDSRRRSADFTVFDGNVGSLSEAVRLRALLDGSQVLSPTSLQVWATCPFRFFLESVLRVSPTEDPEEQWTIDAAEKGSVVHDVLQQFFTRLAVDGRPNGLEPYTAEDHALLQRLAVERLRQTEEMGGAGHPLVWEATRQDLLADLRTFLARDTLWRQSTGLTPRYFEQSFGYQTDWPEVQVVVEGGTLRLRGRIDRVDVAVNGQRAYVLDYKTGSASRYGSLQEDPVAAGTQLQLAVYARAATQALGGSVRAGGAYWFISSRGEFKRIELPDDRAAIDRRLDAVLALMARGIRTGVFPAVPGTDDYLDDWQSNCQWCPFDALCSASRDQDWQRKQTGGCESFTSLSVLSQTGATHGRD